MKAVFIHELLHLVLPYISDFEGAKHEIIELGLTKIADALANSFEHAVS